VVALDLGAECAVGLEGFEVGLDVGPGEEVGLDEAAGLGRGRDVGGEGEEEGLVGGGER